MMRHCDGTDPNLTREIPVNHFDSTMTVSPWNTMASPGQVVIQCQCGLSFDDSRRRVLYPHQPLNPRIN